MSEFYEDGGSEYTEEPGGAEQGYAEQPIEAPVETGEQGVIPPGQPGSDAAPVETPPVDVEQPPTEVEPAPEAEQPAVNQPADDHSQHEQGGEGATVTHEPGPDHGGHEQAGPVPGPGHGGHEGGHGTDGQGGGDDHEGHGAGGHAPGGHDGSGHDGAHAVGSHTAEHGGEHGPSEHAEGDHAGHTPGRDHAAHGDGESASTATADKETETVWWEESGSESDADEPTGDTRPDESPDRTGAVAAGGGVLAGLAAGARALFKRRQG